MAKLNLKRYGLEQADVRLETERGALRALIPRKRTIASNPHILLVWMVATAWGLPAL